MGGREARKLGRWRGAFLHQSREVVCSGVRRQQGQLGLEQSGKDLKQLLWESDRELKMELKEDGREHSESPKEGTGSESDYFQCTNPFNRIQQFGIRNG